MGQFPIQMSHVQNHWVAPRSTHPFIFLSSIKGVSVFLSSFFFLNIYKNHKLKPRWVGARASKKRGFFVLFILSEGNIFHICVSCQCIVYWIHLQNIQFFTYQKTILHALFCLFLKSGKAFSVSLILIADFSANKLFYVGFFESTFSV